METKEIKIGETTFKIKEVSFYDQINIFENGEDGKVKMRDLLEGCIVEPEVTDDLLKSLTPKQGNELLMAINKLNGWVGKDFPKPL